MILVDTNVISELMRPTPSPDVLGWMDAQARTSLYISVVVQAEILYGVECLPEGQRREDLARQAAAIFEEEFAGRILPVTEAAAAHYAAIAAARRRTGRSFGLFDTLIAATARASGARIATRNTMHFDDCGIDLINPWETAE